MRERTGPHDVHMHTSRRGRTVTRCPGRPPVLMYHGVGSTNDDRMGHFITPERFAGQISALRLLGLRGVSPAIRRPAPCGRSMACLPTWRCRVSGWSSGTGRCGPAGNCSSGGVDMVDGSLTTELLSTAADLDREQAAWDAQTVQASRPYSAPGWSRPWWSYARPPGRELRAISVRDRTGLVGIASGRPSHQGAN
jgi:hypothetical protein